MKLLSFYRGGWLPQCWSSTLKVEDGRLFGQRDRQFHEILPTDIIDIKEFAFNNPFLLLITTEGKFHVGAMTGQYDDVVRVLERYIGSDFCQNFAHRWNVMFFRKQFRLTSFIRSLVSRTEKDVKNQ